MLLQQTQSATLTLVGAFAVVTVSSRVLQSACSHMCQGLLLQPNDYGSGALAGCAPTLQSVKSVEPSGANMFLLHALQGVL